MDFSTQTFHFPEQRTEYDDHPDEDYFLVEDNIFAVYDGVALAYQDPYPSPSPARKAAEIAAQESVSFIQQKIETESPIELLHETFHHVNNAIKDYNESLGITPDTVDYLEKQYAAVVGAFGFIVAETFYFGQIHDAGVMIFDPIGNREIDFMINAGPYREYIDDIREEKDFSDEKAEHAFVREHVVNNTDLFNNLGEKVKIGVMTGEEDAHQFFRVGACNFWEGQVALLYTDGFVPYVYDKGFSQVLFESDNGGISDYFNQKKGEGEKYQHERSMIVIRFS